MQDFNFPKNFLWGTATAAHQVEGNNVNSESWMLEHLPGTIYSEPSGDACDHYHLYPADIALLAKLGFNAYRFSIEWARIEPEEGEFSRASLEHYRRMLAACHENGIKPVVTFHHFTSPRWLIRRGGWLDKGTPERFARYVERTSKHLGDLIGTACTFNEPNIACILPKILPFSIQDHEFWKTAAGAFGVAPEKLGLYQFVTDPAMWDVIYASHQRAKDILYSGQGNFPVGLTLALMDIHSAGGGEETAARFRKELSDVYLERLTGEDFVGVQTYARMVVGPEGVIQPGPDVVKNQLGEEFYPEALEGTIRLASKISGVPVIVTENGWCSDDDTLRIEYIRRALRGIANCLSGGIDVRGYFYWSAMDNFEWVNGYGPKFGIIAVDRETQERTPKPSAHWLGNIARGNRLENAIL